MKQLTTILTTLITLFGCNWTTTTDNSPKTVSEISKDISSMSLEEIKGLDSVNIGFQFAGEFSGYSSDKNSEPSKGEAHSHNLPKMVNQYFPRNGLYLMINPNEFSRFSSTLLGCKLYLVNTTDSLATLGATDSRLDIVAEALNDKNEWEPISYLSTSFCGNSYHTVKLDKDEYWSFVIPVFKGTIKTKLRYVLLLDKYNKIISNEIVAYINRGQFNKEKE